MNKQLQQEQLADALHALHAAREEVDRKVEWVDQREAAVQRREVAALTKAIFFNLDKAAMQRQAAEGAEVRRDGC